MATLSFLHSQLFVEPPVPDHDFSNQVIIITGANRGLGFEAAKHLLRLNAAKVVLAVRSAASGQEAAKKLEEELERPGAVQVEELDMGSQESVKNFVARLQAYERIDSAILNAGIFTQDFVLADDHESTLTVNVVNTFLLAINLVPILKKSAQVTKTLPAITIVSSDRHVMTNLPEWKEANTLSVLSDPKRAKMNDRYYESKLLQIFMARAMAKEVVPAGSTEPTVVINSLTPGYCFSGLLNNAHGVTAFAFKMLAKAVARTTEVGGRALVSAVSYGKEGHGQYFNDSKPDKRALSNFVRSKEGEKAQEKLWGELLQVLEGKQPGIKSLLS